MHRAGDYLFVHAGIRPDVPLEAQTLADLVSIRQPFLWTEQPLGVIVVHGHSSNPSVVRTDNRIGLDTGAGMGGKPDLRSAGGGCDRTACRVVALGPSDRSPTDCEAAGGCGTVARRMALVTRLTPDSAATT